MECLEALMTEVHSLSKGQVQRQKYLELIPTSILLRFQRPEIGQVGNRTRNSTPFSHLNIALLLFLLHFLGNFISIGIFCYSA